jgi:alpha-glucosidase
MTWWRDAVVYQIYPRSFRDSDCDGVGDLEGIRGELDYLVWLGVDTLWLSPIYPSPMKDFGYDVANYVDVDRLFGSLEQFDGLIRDAHTRGLRVLLDWVPNHTSNEHPWFSESRSSRSNPRRDWYVWRDAREGGSPPNNWVRAWSEESAWTWDGATGRYYLHCFLDSQPDLNWANVDVRQTMHDTLCFWLDRGVDGFRMDVVHLLGKDLDADDPDDLKVMSHVPLNDVSVTHEYLREIRAVLDEYDNERVSVGEVYLIDPNRVATYYGRGDELHMSFNFASLYTPWNAEAWRDLIATTEAAMSPVGAWPTWVMSNHDNVRVATRLGADDRRVRAAMTLLLTLRGTPFLYAGEELGLRDAIVPPDRVMDPGGRDGCRSPLPWDVDALHGWPATPRLPFVDNASQFSVEAQRDDPDSMLRFTKTLLDLRHRDDTLRRGDINGLVASDGVLRFIRHHAGRRVMVVVNFSDTHGGVALEGRLLLSSAGGARAGSLLPAEAQVIEL